MQRLISPGESPLRSPGHANRRSAAMNAVTVATVTAMTTLMWMARPGTESHSTNLNRQAQTVSADTPPFSMSDSEKEIVHSGPFTVDGFPHEILFIDDGFTISFPDQTFRIDRIRALWSDLGLADVKEKIGTQGITRIDCSDGLRMYSGSERSLHIAREDFLRILETMNDLSAVSVTIQDVPYTLTIESGWSTMLIPREGKTALTFERRMPPSSVTLAASSKR